MCRTTTTTTKSGTTETEITTRRTDGLDEQEKHQEKNRERRRRRNRKNNNKKRCLHKETEMGGGWEWGACTQNQHPNKRTTTTTTTTTTTKKKQEHTHTNTYTQKKNKTYPKGKTPYRILAVERNGGKEHHERQTSSESDTHYYYYYHYFVVSPHRVRYLLGLFVGCTYFMLVSYPEAALRLLFANPSIVSFRCPLLRPFSLSLSPSRSLYAYAVYERWFLSVSRDRDGYRGIHKANHSERRRYGRRVGGRPRSEQPRKGSSTAE
eukprot:gene6816-4896_t